MIALLIFNLVVSDGSESNRLEHRKDSKIERKSTLKQIPENDDRVPQAVIDKAIAQLILRQNYPSISLKLSIRHFTAPIQQHRQFLAKLKCKKRFFQNKNQKLKGGTTFWRLSTFAHQKAINAHSTKYPGLREDTVTLIPLDRQNACYRTGVDFNSTSASELFKTMGRNKTTECAIDICLQPQIISKTRINRTCKGEIYSIGVSAKDRTTSRNIPFCLQVPKMGKGESLVLAWLIDDVVIQTNAGQQHYLRIVYLTVTPNIIMPNSK